MRDIARSRLLEIISKWEAGDLDEQQVHEAAEALWSEYSGPRELSEDDERSIAIEVVSQLEILNHQLITTEDIPTIVRFLRTPKGEEARAWKKWRRYWDSLDYGKRRAQLASNPYYSTSRE